MNNWKLTEYSIILYNTATTVYVVRAMISQRMPLQSTPYLMGVVCGLLRDLWLAGKVANICCTLIHASCVIFFLRSWVTAPLWGTAVVLCAHPRSVFNTFNSSHPKYLLLIVSKCHCIAMPSFNHAQHISTYCNPSCLLYITLVHLYIYNKKGCKHTFF